MTEPTPTPPDLPPPVEANAARPGPTAAKPRPTVAATAGPRWLSATTVTILIVAIVITASVGVLAFTKNDGAETPEEATRSLLTAVEHNDLLGVVELLPPGERIPARDPVRRIADELQRLRLIGIIDPARVAGPQLAFDDVQLRTDKLGDDVQAVDLVGGHFKVTWPGGGPPLTEAARRMLDRDFGITVNPTGSSYERDFAADPVRLVALREGGGWHVSLAYTAAEARRAKAGANPPEMGKGPAAVGANGPIDAVDDLVRAYADGDPERLVTLMYPNEARALYDYGPLFLPAAREAADRAARTGTYDVQVNRLALVQDTSSGDTRRVTITDLDLDIRDEIHKEHLTFDGTCLHTDERIGDDAAPYTKTDACNRDRPTAGDTIAPRDNPVASLSVFGAGASPPTFTVIERNGRWFVSPVHTLLDSLADTMQQLQPDDVDGWVQRLGASWKEGAGAGVSGVPITPTADEVRQDPTKVPERAKHLAEACAALSTGDSAAAVTKACLQHLVDAKQVVANDLPPEVRSLLG